MSASTERSIAAKLVDYFLALHDSQVSVVNVLYRVIHHDSIKRLIIPLSHFSIMLQVLLNPESELHHITRYDHQSGLYQFLVSSVSGRRTDAHDVATVLHIDVRTAQKAKDSRLNHHVHYHRHGNHRCHLLKQKTKRK